jgi:pimeloyl-ACP methyl ester carboxylesterase
VKEHTRRRVVSPDGAVLSVHTHAARHAPPEVPTVVLAHGWTLTHESWHPVVDALADEPVRIVLWDQRGHGKSAMGLHRKEISTVSIEHLGRDLAAVLDDVVPHGSPLVLAGHSMGGMAVMAYAAQHPDAFTERVRGVLLVATASHGLEMGRRPGEVGLMRLLAKGVPVPAGPMLRAKSQRAFLFGDDADPAHVDAALRQVSATRLTTLGAFYGALNDLDVRTAFPALSRVPLSIVVGRKDRLTPTERARALWLALPHASFTELPTAGHMLTYEATDVLAAEARALLAHTRG